MGEMDYMTAQCETKHSVAGLLKKPSSRQQGNLLCICSKTAADEHAVTGSVLSFSLLCVDTCDLTLQRSLMLGRCVQCKTGQLKSPASEPSCLAQLMLFVNFLVIELSIALLLKLTGMGI